MADDAADRLVVVANEWDDDRLIDLRVRGQLGVGRVFDGWAAQPIVNVEITCSTTSSVPAIVTMWRVSLVTKTYAAP